MQFRAARTVAVHDHSGRDFVGEVGARADAEVAAPVDATRRAHERAIVVPAT